MSASIFPIPAADAELMATGLAGGLMKLAKPRLKIKGQARDHR